ncbi:PQQ-dependent sugar dehydrogenase [Halogeometricum limi]|uniref:Glucose/arabinose dehydrogenase, beta-propeller fold n=1 Tax=Halogeometricum limi TaxID=555875 RepID=A0A1I6GTE8_9EURY|nr:PQQ-dependent sugar dehydrogenase [Halogeometricum limi]SFR45482.1 Glucose/arabinose dehydrogenase, beta-propeller fold [Halogeometricum limi]
MSPTSDSLSPASRRRVLAAGFATVLSGLAGCSSAPTSGDDGTDDETARTGGETGTSDGPADASVAVERVAEGFVSPVDFYAPAGTDRRFVVDQPGAIYEVTADGARDAPYFDVRDRVVDLNGYDERGLLGVAPHPEFAENGRLFVRYSAPRRQGTPNNYSHTFVLSEFTVDPEARTASVDDERTLLEIPQPQSNHNAGAVGFGPDGYLYVATGDGGGGGDSGTGHVDDWYDAVSGGNGQDVTENLLGSILRIDVDSEGDGRPYGIPEDNPLVGRDGLDEQYAWGFRNPWRFSFDVRGSDDWDLYVADVGQNEYEEVSIVENGGNYGWNVREATHCFRANDCPTTTPDGDPLVDPVIEYPHSGDGASGIAVVGGYVVRGDSLPELTGAYLFADWRTGGRLFAADPGAETTPWPVAEVPFAGDAKPGSFLTAFGRDGDDLYVLTTGVRGITKNSGELFRLVAP